MLNAPAAACCSIYFTNRISNFCFYLFRTVTSHTHRMASRSRENAFTDVDSALAFGTHTPAFYCIFSLAHRALTLKVCPPDPTAKLNFFNFARTHSLPLRRFASPTSGGTSVVPEHFIQCQESAVSGSRYVCSLSSRMFATALRRTAVIAPWCAAPDPIYLYFFILGPWSVPADEQY